MRSVLARVFVLGYAATLWIMEQVYVPAQLLNIPNCKNSISCVVDIISPAPKAQCRFLSFIALVHNFLTLDVTCCLASECKPYDLQSLALGCQ